MDVDFTGTGTGGMAPPNAPTPSQLLGFLVPGGPVRTDFVPADALGTKFTLTLETPGDLPLPLSTVPEVVCFLLPNPPLPSHHGVLIYRQISVPGMEPTGFELLGAISHERPSGIFRTGFGQDESLFRHAAPTVTLGVSVEPLANIDNISPQRFDNRMQVAQKIATDLYTFMQSFDTGAVGGMMTVPTNIFERWMQRFEARYQRDPNFFMKNE